MLGNFGHGRPPGGWNPGGWYGSLHRAGACANTRPRGGRGPRQPPPRVGPSRRLIGPIRARIGAATRAREPRNGRPSAVSMCSRAMERAKPHISTARSRPRVTQGSGQRRYADRVHNGGPHSVGWVHRLADHRRRTGRAHLPHGQASSGGHALSRGARRWWRRSTSSSSCSGCTAMVPHLWLTWAGNELEWRPDKLLYRAAAASSSPRSSAAGTRITLNYQAAPRRRRRRHLRRLPRPQHVPVGLVAEPRQARRDGAGHRDLRLRPPAREEELTWPAPMPTRRCPSSWTTTSCRRSTPAWLSKAVKPKQFIHIDQSECITCEGCVDICPWKCIHLVATRAIDEAVGTELPGEDPGDHVDLHHRRRRLHPVRAVRRSLPDRRDHPRQGRRPAGRGRRPPAHAHPRLRLRDAARMTRLSRTKELTMAKTMTAQGQEPDRRAQRHGAGLAGLELDLPARLGVPQGLHRQPPQPVLRDHEQRALPPSPGEGEAPRGQGVATRCASVA